MIKKLSLFFTTLIAITIMAMSAMAAEGVTISLQIDNPTITVDGTEFSIDDSGTAPVIENNRTLLPVRAVVEAMGATAAWDGQSRTTTITKGENTIRLTIGETVGYLNEQAQTLDAAPQILNNRTMLPIRFIAESFGYEINWNETSRVIALTLADSKSSEDKQEETESDSKSLVVYFSMPETTSPENMTQEEENSTVVIDGVVLGNTQYIAQVIQEQIDADIFRIEPATPYPTDHTTLVDLASDEKEKGVRPAIKETIHNIEAYDTIFIGYPNWWGDMPMILYTFFEEYDLSGKTVVPFNTHGGSGFSSTIDAIAVLQPNANVETNGYSISRNNVHEAEPDVIKWLNGLGYELVK